MRTVGALLFLCAAVLADEYGVVGVQARRNMTFRNRTMPVTVRQMGVVVGKDGLILTPTLGPDAENVRVFVPGTTEPVDAEVVDSDTTFTVLRAQDIEIAAVAFDKEWKPAVGQPLRWVGILSGATGKWSAVAKSAAVDVVVDRDGTQLAYSDPPFRGPVVSSGALILSGGKAVGIMVLFSEPNTQGGGRGGGRMRRPGAGMPLVRPAATFAHYLTGTIASRGVLGINGEALGEKVAEALGMTGTKGVLVTQVTPGSGAAAAGIQAEHVITKVGETNTPTLAALMQALRGKKEGESVAVETLRMTEEGTATQVLQVKLGAREETNKADRFRARRFGFTVEPITATVRRDQALGEEVQGLHVRRVARGGPAALATPRPLRRGDVILKVGDTAVPEMAALKKALKGIADGVAVKLFVRKGADTRFVEVKPEAVED